MSDFLPFLFLNCRLPDVLWSFTIEIDACNLLLWSELIEFGIRSWVFNNSLKIHCYKIREQQQLNWWFRWTMMSGFTFSNSYLSQISITLVSSISTRASSWMKNPTCGNNGCYNSFQVKKCWINVSHNSTTGHTRQLSEITPHWNLIQMQWIQPTVHSSWTMGEQWNPQWICHGIHWGPLEQLWTIRYLHGILC